VGWLGADALTGTEAVGSTVTVNSNAGPVRVSACTTAGGAAGTVVSPQPSPVVGAVVLIIGGPSPVCSAGVAYWEVQFGGTTSPPPTSPQPSFSDTFSTGSMDTTKWQVNAFTQVNYAGAGSTLTSSAGGCDYSTGMLRITLTQPTASTSTGCELQSKMAFGYGTYEWSIRASSTSVTPHGAGTTFSGSISTGFIISDATSRTEIDSPEIEGQTPTKVEFTNWKNEANNGALITTTPSLCNPQDGFHKYKFVWTATSVAYYIDGILVGTHTTDIPQATSPGFVIMSHYGTNSSSFGGVATVGQIRYMYVNSFTYTPPAGTTCTAF
jgi:beta-glucanase (GH16 family)